MPIVLAILNWALSSSSSKPRGDYITNIGTIQSEIVNILGQPLADPALIARIERAIELGEKGDTVTAIALYRQLVEQAPVPSLYNNLGVLYATRNDKQRARAAFEQALARDAAHEAAIRNAAALETIEERQVEVSGREAESNDNPASANLMRMGTAVSGAIGEPADVDSFLFTAESRARDWVAVEVRNLDEQLQLMWRITDAARNPVHDWQFGQARHSDVSDRFVTEPGERYYVQVGGANQSVGRYALSVKALHAYDKFEPNDETPTAPIRIGQTVEANVMDSRDVDAYQFTVSSPGRLTIALENRSRQLAPQIRVLDPLRAELVGWTANSNRSGHLEVPVEAAVAGLHYLEVRAYSELNEPGPYALTVR